MVDWEDIPQMLENGWEIAAWNEVSAQAIMCKETLEELGEEGLPTNLKEKVGGLVKPKPPHRVPRPPMRRK
jgi:hypothetical protein